MTPIRTNARGLCIFTLASSDPFQSTEMIQEPILSLLTPTPQDALVSTPLHPLTEIQLQLGGRSPPKPAS